MDKNNPLNLWGPKSTSGSTSTPEALRRAVPPVTTVAATTVATGTVPTSASKGSLSALGAAGLVGGRGRPPVSTYIKARGYSLRSFNNNYKTLNRLLNEYEESQTAARRLIIKETFSKLQKSRSKFISDNDQVITANDITDEQKDEACTLEEDQERYYLEMQEQLLKLFDDLTPEKVAITESVTLASSLVEPIQITHTQTGPEMTYLHPPPPKQGAEEDDPGVQMMFRALTLNYKLTDHVSTFGGDPQQYVAFRTSFEAAARSLTHMGYTPYMKYLELKKCVKAEPLRLIGNLPNLDSSYQAALDLLERFYSDPQLSLKKITDQIAKLPKMTYTFESLKAFYLELLNIVHGLSSLGLTEDDLGRGLFLSQIIPKLSPSCAREYFKLSFRKNDPLNPVGHTSNIQDVLDVCLFQMQMSQQMREVTGPVGTVKTKKDHGKPQSEGSIPKTFKVTTTPSPKTQSPKQNKTPRCNIARKSDTSTGNVPW